MRLSNVLLLGSFVTSCLARRFTPGPKERRFAGRDQPLIKPREVLESRAFNITAFGGAITPKVLIVSLVRHMQK